MSAPTSSRVTLRALEGTPLDDEGVRNLVIATAHGVAERTGVRLLALEHDRNSITVELNVSRLAAVGFAAELRRLTNAWHEHKYDGRSLWGEPPGLDDDDPADAWKRA